MGKPLINLAIVEDNPELATIFTHFFRDQGRYRIVGVAHDGGQGLEMLSSQAVDVALLDLVLPGKDGFYILEELSKQPEKKPICIVLSGISHDHLTQKAFEKGADFFVFKPVDLPLLGRRVEEIWDKKKEIKALSMIGTGMAEDSGYGDDLARPVFQKQVSMPEEFALRVLHDMMIHKKLGGYHYLKKAIMLAVNDASMLHGITKRLYPTIAKGDGSSWPQVERGIRHALDLAWRDNGGRNYAAFLGYGDPNAKKPTNSEFIRAVVEVYQSEHGTE